MTETSAPNHAEILKQSSVADLVATYRQLRDYKQAEEEALKEKLAAAVKMLDEIAGELGNRLAEENSTSIKTPYGTAIRSLKRMAPLSDPTLFRDFVVSNELWDMVDIRANAPGVADWIEQNGTAPPGVNFSTIYVTTVRK